MKRERLRLSVAIAFVVVGVDQLSKLWAKNAYASGRGELIPGLIELRGFENKGVALGKLWGIGQPLVILLILFIIGLSIYLVKTISKPYLWVTLSVLIGGISANLLDRIHSGGVHDFIGTSVIIFNLADVAIIFGAMAMIVAAYITAMPAGGDEAH